MTDYKYNEMALLDELEDYINSTYSSSYQREDDAPQVFELGLNSGKAFGFATLSAMKYLDRFGTKDGENRKDLLKAFHFCLLALYAFDYNTARGLKSVNLERNLPLPKGDTGLSAGGIDLGNFVKLYNESKDSKKDIKVDVDTKSPYCGFLDPKLKSLVGKGVYENLERIISEEIKILEQERKADEFVKLYEESKDSKKDIKGKSITGWMICGNPNCAWCS